MSKILYYIKNMFFDKTDIYLLIELLIKYIGRLIIIDIYYRNKVLQHVTSKMLHRKLNESNQ